MTISNRLNVPSYNGQPFLVDAELRDTVDNLKIKASFVYPQIDPLVSKIVIGVLEYGYPVQSSNFEGEYDCSATEFY